MLLELQQLNQKVFMLEYAPEDPGAAAANAALVRCHAMEDAQLAAATALVEQSRAVPQAPVYLSPQAPLG